MPRYHRSILLPGNEITAMAEQIEEGGVEEQPQDFVLGGPYETSYDNQFRVAVQVINEEPFILGSLFDHDGHLVTEIRVEGTDLDTDYVFEHGQDVYELTIIRAANTVLLDAEVEVYTENGGVRCPCCGSDDLHQGKVKTDASIAWCRVECCSCGARWKDQYQLTGISREEDDFEPPTQNVARSDGG